MLTECNPSLFEFARVEGRAVVASSGASKERGHATAWLDADQQTQIMKDTGCAIGPTSVAMLVLPGCPLVEI